jgi:hypothetical protein
MWYLLNRKSSEEDYPTSGCQNVVRLSASSWSQATGSAAINVRSRPTHRSAGYWNLTVTASPAYTVT